MIHEQNDMRGRMTLRMIDKNGLVVVEQHNKNRIVRTGRLLVAQLFGGVSAGTPPTQVSHIAVGTNGDTATDGQTALGAERARTAVTEVLYNDFEETTPEGPVQRVRVRLSAEFDFGEANGPDPLREAGILTADAGGTMYNRVVFQPVTKSNTFQLSLLWEIIF